MHIHALLGQHSTRFDMQVSVIVWVVVVAFAITFVITMLALIDRITVKEGYLKILFAKLILEIVAAGLFLFYAGISSTYPDRQRRGIVKLTDPGRDWPVTVKVASTSTSMISTLPSHYGRTVELEIYPPFQGQPHMDVKLIPGVPTFFVVRPHPRSDGRDSVWSTGLEVDFMWPSEKDNEAQQYFKTNNLIAEFNLYP